jgi:DNA-binding CsgD family transcriptional regulator
MADVIGRVSSPRFVGRQEELQSLQSALDRTREGTGSVVLIGAEAGIGKSRLIGELASLARAADATVLIGECLPLGDGELPYAPIVGALRSLARERGSGGIDALARSGREELTRLLPELGAGFSEAAGRSRGSQARLFEELLAVLVDASREAPVVFVVEDLQWSDRSTRDFLAFLVRGTRQEKLALVVSYRSDELLRRHPARSFLLELERSGRAVRLDLPPFTRAEIRQQVRAIIGTVPEAGLVERLWQRGEGNAFFTEELLASDIGASVPDSLRDTLLLRVEGCTESARAVLLAAAAAGREVDDTLLEAVVGLPTQQLAAALHELIDGHVLIADARTGHYAFRHALLREAVYADLLPRERRALHLRIAEALEEHPELAPSDSARSAELALHFHAARQLPEALAASVAAGLAAETVYAFGEALIHYERALELWGWEATVEIPLDRLELTRRAAEAANLAGVTERAVALARETLVHVDPGDLARVALAHERLGRYLWTAGRGEDALPEYRRAVELMPVSPPSAERAQVLAAEAQVLMLCGRMGESAPECAEALAIARSVGAREVEANVLNTMIPIFSIAGDTDSAIDAMTEALAIARELRLAEEIGRSYVNGSDALDQAGRIPESIELALEGVEVGARMGADALVGGFLRGELVGRLLRTGRWSEADAMLAELLDRALTGTNAGLVYGHLGWLEAQRGEFDTAARALARAEHHVARAGGSMWAGPLAEGRASNELWRGDVASAAEIVDRCLAAVADGEWAFFTARLYELGTRACAEIALQAPGDERTRARQAARADALLERLDRLIAQLPGTTQPRVLASRQAALAERARIDGRSAADDWRAAQHRWDECGDPYQAAYARWRGAEALLASGGDRREAELLARDAHAVAGELGARPLREGLEALARRASMDLDRHGPRKDRDYLRDELELTPREREVLALLGDGLTNRQIAAELFISDKTASVHVSRILAKLSVPNRASAAAAAQRLGVTRPPDPNLSTQ